MEFGLDGADNESIENVSSQPGSGTMKRQEKNSTVIEVEGVDEDEVVVMSSSPSDPTKRKPRNVREEDCICILSF